MVLLKENRIGSKDLITFASGTLGQGIALTYIKYKTVHEKNLYLQFRIKETMQEVTAVLCTTHPMIAQITALQHAFLNFGAKGAKSMQKTKSILIR